MRGNGKVFISHAHDDNARCDPLLAALDGWGVDYWFDTRRMEAGDDLAHAIQTAIRERDIFIRVCTPAAQQSYWVRLETGAFRGLQARGHREGSAPSRVLLNLIMDAAYEPEPFDYAHIFIDAARRPEAEWLEELRRALGVGATAAASAHRGDLVGDDTGTLSVHAGGKGRYTTIGAAVAAARAGETIDVWPGLYAEELTITKALTLRGMGQRGEVVIEGRRASALRFEAAYGALSGLTLRQAGGKNADCVVIAAGKVEISDCEISAETGGACVNIMSRDEVLLRKNSIHDGGGWGVFAGGTGIVTLEENEITAHAYSGLTIMRGAYVLARGNRITRNAQHGVRIDLGGGGSFEDNDLRGNFLDAWNIDPKSFGQVLRERNKG
ncbi:MAG TPA: TIR domain-containing protein [Ktedonobacterales bacterium]|nr:TIR domain-containing protein [Ktedonobacterales bacterium]